MLACASQTTVVLVPISTLVSACLGEEPTCISCVLCRAPLELHIPQVDKPERMLGTCVDCGAWYLLDHTVGSLALLPSTEALGAVALD